MWIGYIFITIYVLHLNKVQVNWKILSKLKHIGYKWDQIPQSQPNYFPVCVYGNWSWRSMMSARTPAAVVSLPAPAPWITNGFT